MVGAGPTGLTLALVLRKLGVACELIEKNAEPSSTSKALGLQYRVSELLAWLGLYPQFARIAATQSRVNLYADGHLLCQLVLHALRHRAGQGGFVPCALILPQSETERLLGQRLQEVGGRVQWSRELIRFTQDADGVEAELADGERIHARYLVSCEGAHGVCRKQAGIGFVGNTYPQEFIMADVAIHGALRPGEAHSWLHPDGVLTAITMPGAQRFRLFIETPGEQPGPVTLELVRSLYIARSRDARSEITDATWLTHFKIHSRMVEHFRNGRVFLAATPRTCTRRPGARASPPACRTPTTWDGSWRTCSGNPTAAGCSTLTSSSVARRHVQCWPRRTATRVCFSPAAASLAGCVTMSACRCSRARPCSVACYPDCRSSTCTTAPPR